MGKEIERKFLVKDDIYKENSIGILCRQGYMSTNMNRTVRIRINEGKGFLTIKGKSNGAVRTEFEYQIPIKDAHDMLNELCIKPIIEKHRYFIEYEGFNWMVDEFHGENEGLIIAEIELESEEQEFLKPDWIGEEVTYDSRYYNSNLVENPYKNW